MISAGNSGEEQLIEVCYSIIILSCIDVIRVCEARRCLTLWHGRALERRAKEDTMERLGAVRACRRVLKAWVSCSLVQPTVLTKAVIKMQEVHRMRVALLCWSIAMDKRKKENDRDDVLEQFAVSVHLNHTKRTKQHSWNAWLKSRNILEKEIKVQKLTKIASMKVMFHCWMQSIEVLKRRDRVKDKHRLRSCKDVLITWKRKVSCSDSITCFIRTNINYKQ